MSKAPWNRCPVSGISLAKLKWSADMRDDQTGIDTALLKFQRCNVFDVRSIAWVAGFGQRPDHWKARALCGSYFHLVPIMAVNSAGYEVVIGWATHTDSADWGGKKWREAARDRQLAGKQPAWDVTQGSGRLADLQPIETRVTAPQGSERSHMWHLSGAPL